MNSFADRSPTARFTDRAGDYARFRPSYPAEAIDAIFAGLGEPAALTAADVGAGTGISSRLLADRGADVMAVEPNAAMRDAADPHPRVRWIDATAEATTLPDASVDLVLCAQAFHWFRPEPALAEFRRVLRPSGRVALMWNDRDPGDSLTAGYSELIAAVSQRDVLAGPLASDALSRCRLFTRPRAVVFRFDQPLSLEALVGRALSASYVPKAGRLHDDLVRGLTALHAAHADAAALVHLRYQTSLFLASPAPVPG